MACAKCSFYLPKESTKAQLLEGKANLLRLRQDIPLVDAELAAVEDGLTGMSSCWRSWSTCRRQRDLHRVNSPPDVWCNSKRCATKRGRVPNSGDRQDSDRALRLICHRIRRHITHNAVRLSD